MKSSANGLWKLVGTVTGKKTQDPLAGLISQFDSVNALLHVLHGKLTASFKAASSSDTVTDLFEDTGDWNFQICERDVRNLLAHVSPSKASGQDGIPSTLYRCLADIIALPLTTIFNSSVTERSFPLVWKRGIMIPIPKTQPADIARLRFISLLPVPSKILERLVLRGLKSHFEVAYGVEQHGFRHYASTTSALVSVTDSALRCLNQSSLFGSAIVSYDMSRAFDTIEHSLAIRKLRSAGFSSDFLCWLQSYFCNRSGAIKIRGHQSADFPILRGVPQGSVLGPAVFCTYVNDIKSCLPGVTTVKFADDITLVIPITKRDPNEIKILID